METKFKLGDKVKFKGEGKIRSIRFIDGVLKYEIESCGEVYTSAYLTEDLIERSEK